MTAANLPDALRRFVDEEMLRAPLVIETVIDATLADMRAGWAMLSSHDRSVASKLQQTALSRRPQLVQRFVQSLREHVDAELRGDRLAGGPTAPQVEQTSTLSLLDEDSVAADVELSHMIDGVKREADAELREMAAFISALLGDMDVARDHNMFRPENIARALWDAVHLMPVTLGFHIAFMRHARKPLTTVLRRSYAGAVTRLQSSGVDRAVHRTMIMTGGSRAMRPTDSWTGAGPNLHLLRDSMPLPWESVTAAGDPAPVAQPGSLGGALHAASRALATVDPQASANALAAAIETQRSRLLAATASNGERQSVELLCMLFQSLLLDRRLSEGVPNALAPMLTPALRLGLGDRSALDDYTHPLWRYIDRLAFLADVSVADRAERAGLLKFAEGVTQQLVREAHPSSEQMRWALQRLAAWEEQRLARRRAACAGELASLEALERRVLGEIAAASTMSGALDVGHLDTVPAVLLESLPDTPGTGVDPDGWVAQRGPGDWLNIFIQGRRTRVLLIWQSPEGEISLFADVSSPASWAVRRRALVQLRAERLLTLLRPPSLATEAALKLQRRFEEARPATSTASRN